MVDITHKNHSLRKAIAQATVKTSSPATIQAVEQRKVPKGDVFEFARAAGLLAIKKTSDVIPDCHPLPVEFSAISYRLEGLNIIINVEVHTIYKTGVEVEAMHGAAITALTIYDMLKPIDKAVEIASVQLLSKEGGKSSSRKSYAGLRSAVVVCSDSISKGENQDKAGKAIIDKLAGFEIKNEAYAVIADDLQAIQDKLRTLNREGFDLVIFSGGTGLSPRDNTPEAIAPLLDKEIPGIMETARSYGQKLMPFAMLSRGIAGFMGDTLVMTTPGSPNGAVQTIDAVFPHILHVFDVRKGLHHG